MSRNWLRGLRKHLALSGVVLLAAAGAGRADDQAALKAQLESQQRQIEELKRMVERNNNIQPVQAADGDKDKPKIDEKEVQKIVDGYLKDHPGAGMPPSVQTGFETANGFVIRSAPNPSYVKWEDESKIPFELRIRGRIQADYYGYKVTDSRNHLTGVDTFNNTSPDYDQLLIKRARLIMDSTLYDPNLRFHLEFDGNTRGLAGLAGGGVPGTTGVSATGGGSVVSGTATTIIPGVPGGNNIATVDHAVRLFSAYGAYDWHPCWSYLGCGVPCPDGTYSYQPTVTFIIGKYKPLFSFEEYLGSGNQQFVEYAMSEWFFDAEDDNLQMQVGTQVKAFDDRFYLQAALTNGNETQTANLQMDDLPGFNLGLWWDFGGNWNETRKRWDLYGDCVSDIDYSCKPVVRVGAAMNLVPMDRRTEFTNAELNRVRTISGAPGGSTLVGLLNGGGLGTLSPAGISQFAVDAFDEYTYEAWIAGKWRGASFLLDSWVRNMDNFRGRRLPNGSYPGNGINAPILYTDNYGGASRVALFPSDQAIVDYGFNLQGGYFLIPKKLELAARWSYVRGESGAINGDGTFSTLTAAQRAAAGIPASVTTPVVVVGHAFRHDNEANEYAIGLNYFFRRQQVKWQTDLSFYNGGNPAAGGQSAAGFIPGVDGYMLRTQFQIGF